MDLQLAGKRDVAISLLLALTFSIVICLIADLERGRDHVRVTGAPRGPLSIWKSELGCR